MELRTYPFFALLLFVSKSPVSPSIITVDLQRPERELKHFWKSTGFCPPLPHTQAHQYDLSIDQQLNLAYVGSVPHGGIQQVRIHWMMELVSAQDTGGIPQYNFTKLDQLIELLHINGLNPGFELMGSVSNYFNDFENKSQVLEWKNLVHLIAKRYIDKYGLEMVSQWNFETWNEPSNHDFDNVTMTIQGFLNYYDACSEGLRTASSLFRFGGPGDSCHSPPHSMYCWAMLQHCYNGTNFFTGETGVRIDYIALHKKGGGHSLPILQQEIETVEEIHKRFPRFRSVPVYNDEADPLVGWSRPQGWRADVTYAALVIKVINQHQDWLLANPHSTFNFTMLSNDNGFLSYHPHPFTQRTLTARFQVNNTLTPHVQLVRKPVLTVMALLALLGETQVLSQLLNSTVDQNGSLGVLASIHKPAIPGGSDSWQAAVLVYRSDDTSTSQGTEDVSVVLIPYFSSYLGPVYVTYYMDNDATNPYLVWQSMGSPTYPTAEQFRHLRSMEGPRISGPWEIPPGDTLTLKTKLPMPSVLLIHVCTKPMAPPGQVNILLPITRFLNCCLQYVPNYQKNGSKEFRRVNLENTIFTSFVHTPVNQEVAGLYRVRAVDYWKRPGSYSLPKRYLEK
uniref:Alpha-L-iduronidase n=1 Tax=Oryzias sinensis TaxID=183150 RepID=A0A8C7Z8I4_9TELE